MKTVETDRVLKRCPRCKGALVLETNDRGGYRVRCTACTFKSRYEILFFTLEDWEAK